MPASKAVHDTVVPVGRAISASSFTKKPGPTVSWTALLAGMLGPDGHRGILEQHSRLQA